MGEWKLTFVIEDATVFQSKYTSFAFFHILEVVANLQTLQVSYIQCQTASVCLIDEYVLSVYSSWNCLSMFSSSCWRFLASSFSFFLLLFSHESVSSTSASASPRVVPLSAALSSRRFLTLHHESRKLNLL
jgi:hypothetical protein